MSRTVGLAMLLNLVLLTGAAAGPTGPVFLGDPQAIAKVQAAYQKFSSAHTWRSRITAPGGGAQSGTQVMDHVAPDRYHMAFSQGGQTSEMFMIGHDTWMRTGGACRKLPTGVPIMNPREAVEHGSDAKITVTQGGPETVEGDPTDTYMLTVDSGGKQVQEKLFVATGTGLPRRVEIPSNRGTTIIDYFDYDAPITIDNPPC